MNLIGAEVKMPLIIIDLDDSYYSTYSQCFSSKTFNQTFKMSDSDDDPLVTKPFKFVTAGFDARFPNQNQTKHCWQNYVDYHKCILAKGEDFAPCRQFFLAYRSLCPSAWCARWDDQRGKGTFPVNLDE